MTKIIINVGRQIGSGGHIIAEKLARADSPRNSSSRTMSRRDSSSLSSILICHSLAITTFITTTSHRKAYINSRATPSRRLPIRATAFSWAEPPIMCSVTTRM